jgi:quercetin dioxygenase-like cupin family protein
MEVIRPSDVTPQEVTDEGARGATIRVLISKPQGAPNFAMRLFEAAPGGCTPLHEHPWEHEVYILEGPVEIFSEQGPIELNAGDAVFVSPGERHQIRNTGEGAARFLCLIPHPED